MARLARNALPIIAVGQFLAAGVNAWTGLGVSLGERAQISGVPPELPPGPFFSIWALIFGLYLVFAIYAAAKDEPAPRVLSSPLALAGLGNIA